ncbi:MAG: nitrous oxide reductase family maturation protein NosD [Deltaproteobacteria bacterium]|nr:nitrous oxide reductase family maturation protein NosD [Deltaproteobacteria bacterium]
MKTVLASACVLLLAASSARAETLRVGDGGRSLADTIALANDGDVVEVPAGEWPGRIRIEKRITLRGEGTIDGGGEGRVIEIIAPGVVVEGLTIEGSGSNISGPDACIYIEPSAVGAVVRGNLVRDCAFGIWVHTTPRVELLDNHIIGRADVRVADRGNGIQLFDASHLVIRGNRIEGARDGLYVSATEDSLIEGNRMHGMRYGVHYMYSYRNTIRGNVANGNGGGFALMESHDLVVEDNTADDNQNVGLLFRDAEHCQIRDNHLARNGQGMFFFSSVHNTIEDNLMLHNGVGAKIWAGSVDNLVRGNRFVGNRQQVFYVGNHDLVWGEAGRGNYYSDYIGWDQDGDGVGDRPYRVDSFTANLMHRFPAAVLLMRSPVLELLSRLSARMPILRVPTVEDRAPLVGDVAGAS